MGRNYPPEHDMLGSKIIRAKFKSYCALTGETINIGDECLWDTTFGKVYSNSSRYFRNFKNQNNEESK